ncbi:uncharacterized protein PAC_11301 [Phialocephala subalpina]|uniref:C2H2-type domain-containing protein n=1 Tax=Phialocephala subalpina TaxID=576137 RepID=A0A1L7X8P1_9HELO|nr:uncharacterized protein PAC_11301 [Phialocephala subalpina]
MEPIAYDGQLHLSNEANDWKDPFDAFIDFSAYVTHSKSGGQNRSLNVSASSGLTASTSTCLRGFKDNDGFDLICFCTQCQDSFLAQEIHNDGSGSKSIDIISSLQSSPDSIGEVTTDISVSPPSSCSSPSSRGSSKRQRHGSKSSGISKPSTNVSKPRPEVLIDQLEVALHGDENTSAEFKFKTSVLFNELKKLIEAESSSQRLSAVVDTRPAEVPVLTPSCHRRRGLPKRKVSKNQSSEKIFQCTWPACQYASSSAMDWKRHEETHWPQKRYMCLECAATPELDLSQCPYCLYAYPSRIQEALNNHLLQCESAKRNGRTFARKDKLSEHLQKDHASLPGLAMSRAATWTFEIDSGWTRNCGFCGILLDTWDERARHLVEYHFKQGADLRSWQPVFPNALKHSTGLGLDTKNFDVEFCQPLPAQDPYLSTELQAQFAGWRYNRADPVPTVGIPPLQQPPQDVSGFSFGPAGSSTSRKATKDSYILSSRTPPYQRKAATKVQKDSEGFGVPAPMNDPISQALAEIQHRRSASLKSDMSNQMRRFLVEQGYDQDASAVEKSTQFSGSFLLQDVYLADVAKKGKKKQTLHTAVGSHRNTPVPSVMTLPAMHDQVLADGGDYWGESSRLPQEQYPLSISDSFGIHNEFHETSALEKTETKQALPTTKTLEDPHIRRLLSELGWGHAAEAQQAEWIARMGHHPYFSRRRDLLNEGYSETIVDMSEEIRGLRQMMLDDQWGEEYSSKPWQRFSSAEAERLKQTLLEEEYQAPRPSPVVDVKNRKIFSSKKGSALIPPPPTESRTQVRFSGKRTLDGSPVEVTQQHSIPQREWALHFLPPGLAPSKSLPTTPEEEAELETLKGRPGEHPYWPRRRQLIYELKGLDTKERIEEIVDQIQEIRDLRRMEDEGDWGEEYSARSRAYFSAEDLERLKQTLKETRRKNFVLATQRAAFIVDKMPQHEDQDQQRRMTMQAYRAQNSQFGGNRDPERIYRDRKPPRNLSLRTWLQKRVSQGGTQSRLSSRTPSSSMGEEKESTEAEGESVEKEKPHFLGQSASSRKRKSRSKQATEATRTSLRPEAQENASAVEAEVATEVTPITVNILSGLPSSPNLPRWSAEGDFTMDEDTARILGETDESSQSILRWVPNAVCHGRNDNEANNSPRHTIAASKENLEWQERVTMLKEAMAAQQSSSQPRNDLGLARMSYKSYADECAAVRPKSSLKTWVQKLSLPFRNIGNKSNKDLERGLLDQKKDAFADLQKARKARRKSQAEEEERLTSAFSAMARMSIAEASSSVATKIANGTVGKRSRLPPSTLSSPQLLPPILSVPAIEWEERPRYYVG